MRLLGVLVAAVVLSLTCACGVPWARNCTLVGALDGLRVEIPAQLFVASGSVTFKVCDQQGCGSATRQLAKMPADVRVPIGRAAVASFEQLGRTFKPGRVEVTVTLRGPNGALVAQRTETVTLTHYYPNGKDCDSGDTSGSLTFAPGDSRTPLPR